MHATAQHNDLPSLPWVWQLIEAKESPAELAHLQQLFRCWNEAQAGKLATGETQS